MPDDTGLDPKDVAGANAMAAARRMAVAEQRQRAHGAGGRRGERGERPAGLLLTSVVVIAVVIGVLAIMIYTR